MRTLLMIIISATLFWSAYWTIGAQRTKAGINTWLTEKNDTRFDIYVGDMSISGFPNRFDVTMTPLRIEVNEWGFAWRGDFLQILRLSYNKDHEIFIFPERQELKLDDIDVKISSDRMLASSILRRDGTRRIVLEAQNLSVKSEKVNLRFGNTQLAFLLSRDGSKLRLSLTSKDAQSMGGPDSLLLSANLFAKRTLVDEDLALFDVRALLFNAIRLQMEDKIIFRGREFLTFAELLAVPEMLKALAKITIN